MIYYKDSCVIPRLVIPRLENVDKVPKLNPRINFGISSDLQIAFLDLTQVHKTGHETWYPFPYPTPTVIIIIIIIRQFVRRRNMSVDNTSKGRLTEKNGT